MAEARIPRRKLKLKRVFRLKYYQKINTFIHLFIDAMTISVGFLFAYYLWGYIGPLLAIDMYEQVSISRYSLLLGATQITLLIGFEVNGLYYSQRSMLNIKEFSLILKTCIMACGVTMVVLYMANELYFSRGMFVIVWLVVTLFLFLERYAFFKLNTFLTTIGVIETRVLVFGTGILAKQLVRKFAKTPKLGYQVTGFVSDETAATQVDGLPVLGGSDELEALIKETDADKLFIAQSSMSSDRVIEILNICRKTGCKFQVVPSTYEMALERVKLTDIEGIPLIGIKEPKISIRGGLVKRGFDILVASLMLILFSPFMFFLTVLIKLTKWEPVILPHLRIGRYQKPFQLYHLGAIPIYRKKKLVFLGGGKKFERFLKRWELDKYPQLWNVVMGDISLVGPKPENPYRQELKSEIFKHKYNVRPGLTGLWELKPGEGRFLDKDLDLYYIHNFSFLLDIVILTRKCMTILLQKKPNKPFLEGLTEEGNQ